MNASVISALAALAGAAIGDFTSVLASLLTQRTQARATWVVHGAAGALAIVRNVPPGDRSAPALPSRRVRGEAARRRGYGHENNDGPVSLLRRSRL